MAIEEHLYATSIEGRAMDEGLTYRDEDGYMQSIPLMRITRIVLAVKDSKTIWKIYYSF